MHSYQGNHYKYIQKKIKNNFIQRLKRKYTKQPTKNTIQQMNTSFFKKKWEIPELTQKHYKLIVHNYKIYFEIDKKD